MAEAVASGIYDNSVRLADSSEVSLSRYRGNVLLIANTASKCGFTPQYAGLEALYRQYKERGLVVLGFPCNQFGGQEPDGNAEIAQFCQLNYGVTFPVFARIEVNGPDAIPLYRHLKNTRSGLLGTEAIKWNFTKFLVDRNGWVVGRYAPAAKPEDLATAIEKLL